MKSARHVRFVPAIDAHGLARATTDGGAKTIHGRVPGAHNQYALAGDLNRGQLQRQRGGLLEDER